MKQQTFGSAESPNTTKIEELKGEGDIATRNLRKRARRSEVTAETLQDKSSSAQEGEVLVL